MTAQLPAVGVHPGCTDYSMPVVEMAKESEARELRSLALPEHTHIPLGSEDMGGGRTMDDRYRHVLDPYVACAFVAAATTTLEVGTAISLVAQHDAIALAKATATLDFLSQGRFMLGVGYGYNRQEAADHGVSFGERALVVEETVRLMRAFWTQEEAAFEGRLRRVPPSWSWPKPARPGGPPVLLGARSTPRNFDRIVAWADGWIPMGGGVLDENFEADLLELRKRWDDAGRSGEVEVCCFFYPAPVSEMAREIERAGELGVQRMQVYVADLGRDELLPILDDVAAAVDQQGHPTT